MDCVHVPTLKFGMAETGGSLDELPEGDVMRFCDKMNALTNLIMAVVFLALIWREVAAWTISQKVSLWPLVPSLHHISR